MTIRYKNDPEDFAAASDWYLTHTTEGKTLIRNAVIRSCLLLALIGGVAAIALPSVIPYLIVECFVGWLVFLFAIPARIKHSSRKRSTELFKKPENSRFLDERTLEISANDLFSYSSQATTALKWTAIDKIVILDSGALFLLGSLQSIFIPRDRIRDGNFTEFVTEAERLHRVAKQPKPIPIPAR